MTFTPSFIPGNHNPVTYEQGEIIDAMGDHDTTLLRIGPHTTAILGAREWVKIVFYGKVIAELGPDSFILDPGDSYVTRTTAERMNRAAMSYGYSVTPPDYSGHVRVCAPGRKDTVLLHRQEFQDILEGNSVK